MTDIDDDDEHDDDVALPVEPERYVNKGGRPPSPDSLVALSERKVMYTNMMQYWATRKRLGAELNKLDISDKDSLKARRGDNIIVQGIKLLALEYHRADDDEMRQKALSKLWDAIAKADSSMSQTHEQQVKIALQMARLKGAGGGEEDGATTPEAVAQQLRDMGLPEAEIQRQMGTSYPGPPE